jgi:hypothetical protein
MAFDVSRDDAIALAELRFTRVEVEEALRVR